MHRDTYVALVLAVAVGLWYPLAHVDWFAGHEKISYVLRTVEWAAELRAGHLYPRWCPDFYGGYGSPLFMFYGPVPYAIAGFLTATFFDSFTALKVLALLSSLLAGLGTYALVFGETRQRDAALVAAVAFLAAPYRIANLFERGDIGEFAALGFLPVALALYRAVAHEVRPRRARWLAIAAAAAHAAMIMTHPILGMWGTILIGVVVVATCAGLFQRGMRRRAGALLTALGCAPGLAAIYIVPALVDRPAASTDKMIGGWYHPQHQWILLRTLFESHVQGTAMPGTMYRIGPIIVLALLAVAIGLLRDVRHTTRALGWVALTAVLIALTLPLGSWFWEPGRVPLAAFIQFPWRLLGPAALTAAIALGIGLAASLERLPDKQRTAFAFTSSAALLLTLAWPHVYAKEMATQTIPADPESIRQTILSATDADEYLPRAVGKPPSRPRATLVIDAKGAVVHATASDGSRHDLVIRSDGHDATVRFGLHSFPGWKVDRLAGAVGAKLETAADGLLQLRLPTPGEHRVRIRFGYSRAAFAGVVISVVAVLVLASLVSSGRRRTRPGAAAPRQSAFGHA